MSVIAYDSRPPRADLVAPFEMEGAPGHVACLLLHGFGCSPYTMRSLAERLSGAGHPCYAPLLPGHGENLEDFNEVADTDWVEAALESFDHLRQSHRKVAVIGFSMGGSLGLYLAAERPVAALVLQATPVFMGTWVDRIYPVARAFTSALPVVFDVANRAARQRRKEAVHKVLPVRAVGELLKVVEAARERLPRVRCPILVAQSRSDHTVPPSNAPYIAENVASSIRRLLWLRRAYHVLPVDYGFKRLEHEVQRFLAQVEKELPQVSRLR